jgi:hypothetical protein
VVSHTILSLQQEPLLLQVVVLLTTSLLLAVVAEAQIGLAVVVQVVI